MTHQILIAAKNVSNKSCRLFQIAGRGDDGTVRTVIRNHPVVAPLPSPIRSVLPSDFNLLKPTGYVMYQQFNIQQLYALPTLYLYVLYLSENKHRLVPLTV